MNLSKKIIASISAMALMGVCCTSTIQEVSNVDTAQAVVDDCNDDWLHADGSRLYDEEGNEVWITGANWFGFNCSENVLHYLWNYDLDEALDTIADHGINCLRVPISTQLLYSWMSGDPDEVSSVSASNDPYYTINPDLVNDDGSLKNSMEIFDIFIQKCKQYGIKVFVDIHSPDTNNSGHNYGIWYGKTVTLKDGSSLDITTEIWQETLVWLAKKFSNDDTIIGYDLKNEPHSTYGGAPVDAIWDNSTAENNWKNAAQNCALAIMEVNPNALIFVEGVETYDGYGAWWGGNLRGVKDYPIDLGEYQSQLVYSPHDYGPLVSAQTWFEKDFTEQTLLDDYWYDTWAYINDQDIAPLLVGEWGGLMDGGDNEKWMTLIRDYMIKNHINHTFWCLNADSGDTGGLWGAGSTIEWDEDKYALFEPSLWQDEDGVYIGLDHQTALGENGQSLSEFYSSGKSSNLDAGDETNPKDPTVTTTDSDVTTTTETSETSAEASETTITTDDSTTSTTSESESVTSEAEEVTTTTADTTTELSTPSETATDTSSSTTSSSNSDTTTEEENVLGDVNDDTEVDGRDLLLLKKYVLGLSEITEKGLINADVNADTEVDGRDLLLLKKFTLGLITLE